MSNMARAISMISPFYAEIETIFGAFNQLYQTPIVNRIGLRYINEITLPDGNPLDWDTLINEKLIASVKACFDDHDMAMVRSLHQVQILENDATMLFHYGLYNPDYPAVLTRRQFILDIDSFKIGTIPGNEVLSTFKQLNEICEKMFEESIEDGLRQRMEVIND